MEYIVLYDLEIRTFQFQIFLIPLSLILLGVIALRQIEKYGYIHPMQAFGFYKEMKLDLFGKFFSFLIAFFGFITLIGMTVGLTNGIIERNTVKEIIESGNFDIIEGQIENFLPFYSLNKNCESFEVSGVNFSYADSEDFYGYSKTSNNGGVINSNGQSLKISYYEKDGKNIIIKIEKNQSH